MSQSAHGKTGLLEYGIIEIQGEVKSHEPSFDGAYIGELEVMENGQASLVIGPQKIIGKAKDLDCPYAVTRKLIGEDGKNRGYEVVAIVRRKFLFVNRPIAVIRKEMIGCSSLK
eukprot:CFRG3394T1